MTGTAKHSAFASAPAERAYRLIADVTLWPLLFGPSLHVDLLEHGPRDERFRIWVTAGGDVRSWTSRRRLDPEALRAEFQQENPKPPFSAVSGTWRFESLKDCTRIVLEHRWDVTDTSSETAKWIREALDRNSDLETGAVQFWAERPEDLDGLIFTFEDQLDIDGPAEAVYDFLYRADLWPTRIDHVARLDLSTAPATDLTGGAEVQTMSMVTAAPDGTEHHTESIRLCFPGERIVYKQTVLPRPLLGHTGEWTVTRHDGRTRAVACHHVAIDPTVVESGPAAAESIDDLRRRVVDALRTNGMRTLSEARTHAEAGVVTS